MTSFMYMAKFPPFSDFVCQFQFHLFAARSTSVDQSKLYYLCEPMTHGGNLIMLQSGHNYVHNCDWVKKKNNTDQSLNTPINTIGIAGIFIHTSSQSTYIQTRTIPIYLVLYFFLQSDQIQLLSLKKLLCSICKLNAVLR